MTRLNLAFLALFLTACGGSAPEPAPPAESAEPAAPTAEPGEPGEPPAALPGSGDGAERPLLTVEECEAQGTVVGDIGDGRVHRPDFRCADGSEPIGRVASGIEGAVCCPNGD